MESERVVLGGETRREERGRQTRTQRGRGHSVAHLVVNFTESLRDDFDCRSLGTTAQSFFALAD